MDNKGYGHIPRTLLESITFLAGALPIRSVPTFIELLIGAMLSSTGFVTDAWLAISPARSWSAYYKWLEQGKWSWVKLGIQLANLIVTFFPQPLWFIIIDDTFVYRCSRKAPGSAVHHQHGNKTNRPTFALGQCWVSMALSVSTGVRHHAIPLLARLMRTAGNSSKLDAAKTLLRAVASIFAQQKVIVLLDSWYMKWPYLQYVLGLGFQAIGQVRRDTALYAVPETTGKRGRGRPRKYGTKYTSEVVATLCTTKEKVFLYGKWQWVHYRSAICLARFLRGRKVRAVWMQFEDDKGNLSKQRLLLSTNPELMAQQVFAYYARRWSIEDMFNQLKNRWGWKETWQQSRQVLHRWTQIISIAYALPQLLATYCADQVENVLSITPWRKKNELTAGRVRLGLSNIFGNVRVRGWWNPTCRKFEPPDTAPTSYGDADHALWHANKLSKNSLTMKSSPPT